MDPHIEPLLTISPSDSTFPCDARESILMSDRKSSFGIHYSTSDDLPSRSFLSVKRATTAMMKADVQSERASGGESIIFTGPST